MKIYNQDKTQELLDIDKTKGKLISDRLLIHHDAVKAEAGVLDHYEVIKEYPNGGKDVKEIWKVEPKAGKEAWDETEDILVYVPYTAEELKKQTNEKRYYELKEELVKVMEDIGQEQLGLVRSDYAEKKARAAEIINELRVLEGKEPREVKKN